MRQTWTHKPSTYVQKKKPTPGTKKIKRIYNVQPHQQFKAYAYTIMSYSNEFYIPNPLYVFLETTLKAIPDD